MTTQLHQAAHAGAILTVDLDAIGANYRLLRQMGGNAVCGAVVKADAYGLGAAEVGPALAQAGCTNFFVAQIDEGIALRCALGATCEIYILNGIPAGAERECSKHHLTPVLNSLDQIKAMSSLARQQDVAQSAILHVDTGMSRLGLTEDELALVVSDPKILHGIKLRAVMSHLSWAEQPEHPANQTALAAFHASLRLIGRVPASLANSSGIFLGTAYHFDLLRPGAALYGVNPQPGQPNPMTPVIGLRARVIQIRTVPAGTAIGYNGRYIAPSISRIATIAVGYADGLLRSLGNRAYAGWQGIKLPIVGSVSMDLITVDITALPDETLKPDDFIDLIGGDAESVDDFAAAAGTIGYEILTGLGKRYFRRYVGTTDDGLK